MTKEEKKTHLVKQPLEKDNIKTNCGMILSSVKTATFDKKDTTCKNCLRNKKEKNELTITKEQFEKDKFARVRIGLNLKHPQEQNNKKTLESLKTQAYIYQSSGGKKIQVNLSSSFAKAFPQFNKNRYFTAYFVPLTLEKAQHKNITTTITEIIETKYLNNTQNELTNLKTQIKSLENEVVHTDNSMKEQSKMFELYIGKKQEKIDKYQFEVDNFKVKIKSLELDNIKIKESNTTLKNQKEILKQQISDVKEEINMIQFKHKNKVSTLQNKYNVKSINKKTETTNTRIDNYITKNQELTKTVKNLSKTLKTARLDNEKNTNTQSQSPKIIQCTLTEKTVIGNLNILLNTVPLLTVNNIQHYLSCTHEKVMNAISLSISLKRIDYIIREINGESIKLYYGTKSGIEVK